MPVATTTIIAGISAAAAVGGLAHAATTKPPKPPKLDPGAQAAPEARTDTGAQVKIGADSGDERVGGKRKKGKVAKGGTALAGLSGKSGLGF